MHNSKAQTINADDMIARYYEDVYRYVRRVVADHDDACDVCQDTFLRALRKLSTLHNADALKPWLFKIATNEAMRLLKKRKLSHEQLSDSLIESLEDQTAERAEVDERLLRFNKAVLKLTPAQHTVFDLRHYEEMSFKDIAEVTGGSADTARVVYHQAKEKIKRLILSGTL